MWVTHRWRLRCRRRAQTATQKKEVKKYRPGRSQEVRRKPAAGADPGAPGAKGRRLSKLAKGAPGKSGDEPQSQRTPSGECRNAEERAAELLLKKKNSREVCNSEERLALAQPAGRFPRAQRVGAGGQQR